MGEIKKDEEQISVRIGSLNKYGDLFHRAAQNTAAGGEIPCNTINGLLSARKYDTEIVEQFIKKETVIPRNKFL